MPTESIAPARRRWSIRIGRLLGIDVYLHATLFVLLAWIVGGNVASGLGWRSALGMASLVAAVFAIVVLHELGHAMAARAFGIRTRDITLYPIGGVARLERIPEQPKQELLIALAGPAVNVGLAVAFGAASLALYGTPVAFDLEPGAPALPALTSINVTLAVFNLLPAFPLDGGRVFRAALGFSLDFRRATEIAARLGKAMAVLLAAFGLFTGPMLLLVAGFIWIGASQELAAVRVRTVLDGLTVESGMTRGFSSLSPYESLARASELVVSSFQRAIPIVDAARVVGVLTREALIQGLATVGPNAPLSDAMHRRVVAARPGDDLYAVLGRVSAEEGSIAIVLDEDRVVGVIEPENVADLIRVRMATARNAELAKRSVRALLGA
jgi:Zn-dependent protease/predicted transcriptional regulator